MTVRATCRVCGRRIFILTDGRIGPHDVKVRAWPPQRCSGWGQLPKEEQ